MANYNAVYNSVNKFFETTLTDVAKKYSSCDDVDRDAVNEMVSGILSTFKNEFQCKPKKKKNVKDPNAPKKKRNAYFFFQKEVRAEVVSRHPEMTFGEVSKELGRSWNDMSKKNKNKYIALAEKDAKRYIKEMEKYNVLKNK